MAILLAIVFGASTILVGQIKMIKGLENSVIAFYAADTGIEYVLNTDITDPSNPSSCTKITPCCLDMVPESCYYVEIIPTGVNCSANTFCIKSVGSYKGTRRAAEVSY